MCLDSWWSAYTEAQPVAQGPASARALDRDGLADSWNELGPWWQAYTETNPIIPDSTSMRAIATEKPIKSWDELDPWWDTYTETGHATAIELNELLEESNDAWRESAAPFDTDPLAADLTLERISHGPLQPTNEMGWSRWLARLLRPSAELVAELFGVEADQSANKVVREDQLSTHDEQDGSFRRPDILVFCTDHGVSVEVKLDDENYSKTAKTAGLIEDHYDRHEWTHSLLLPQRKKRRLSSIVEPPVTPDRDGKLRIEWDDPGSVSVIFWSDVTATIRSLLRRGEVPDDHWAANAYLFCAVAEQQIMGFQPQPVVERLAAPANVVDTIQPIRLAGTLEEQLTYLRARQGS